MAHWWLIVGLATAVGFAFRFIAARESPAGDELYLYALIHDRSLGSTLNAVINQEKTPPLGFVLPWLTAHVHPASLWMRAPSVIAGTALIPATAVLGRKVYGAAAGACAAALIATSPFMVFYGSEARAYSLAALLVTAAALALLKATEPNGRRREWVAFAMLVLAAVLTHYTTIFAILAMVGWAFFARPASRRALAAATGSAGVLFLIWVPSFVTQFGHAGDEARRIADQAPLALHTFSRIIPRALVDHPFQDLELVPGRLGLVLIAVGLLVAAGAAVRDAANCDRGWRAALSPTREGWLIIAVAGATLLGLTMASLQPHRSLLLSRNLISSLPAVAVLVAALLAKRSRPVWPVAAVLVISGLTLGAVNELRDYGRPDIRAAASWISGRWRPGDVILEATYATGPPLDRDLAIHLPPAQRRALELTRNVGLAPFAQALKSGRTVFTAWPTAGYTPDSMSPPRDVRDRFVKVGSGYWPSLVPIHAEEWAPAGKAPR